MSVNAVRYSIDSFLDDQRGFSFSGGHAFFVRSRFPSCLGDGEAGAVQAVK
jgi:hypothetical protein